MFQVQIGHDEVLVFGKPLVDIVANTRHETSEWHYNHHWQASQINSSLCNNLCESKKL